MIHSLYLALVRFNLGQLPPVLSRVALGALIVGLAGCGGGDKGCFGLCDARDDDDDDEVENPEDPTLDLSCYPASGLNARTQVNYAIDGVGQQFLRFFESSAASATETRPVLVWVTGDTWSSNLGVSDGPQKAQDIAQRLGAHYVAVSYRGADQAPWPAQIQDVKLALRFLRAQNTAQDFRIDTNQIFIGGDQAGAHLAALAATSNNISEFEPDEYPEQPDTINLLITLGGAFDFETLLDDNTGLAAMCSGQPDPNLDAVAIRDLFDCAVPAEGEEPLANCELNDLIAASPINYLGSEDPKALFYHGGMDCNVPIAQSEQYNAVYTSNSILLGRNLFTSLADDDSTLASLSAQNVLDDLVTFPEFDCDDET